jgi:hypothetical protein
MAKIEAQIVTRNAVQKYAINTATIGKKHNFYGRLAPFMQKYPNFFAALGSAGLVSARRLVYVGIHIYEY